MECWVRDVCPKPVVSVVFSVVATRVLLLGPPLVAADDADRLLWDVPVLAEVMLGVDLVVLTAIVDTVLAATEVETGRMLLVACMLDVDLAVVVTPEVAPSAIVVVIGPPLVTVDDAG